MMPMIGVFLIVLVLVFAFLAMRAEISAFRSKVSSGEGLREEMSRDLVLMSQERDEAVELNELAWGIIANAMDWAHHHGTSGWKVAAERWRDRWHKTLKPNHRDPGNFRGASFTVSDAEVELSRLRESIMGYYRFIQGQIDACISCKDKAKPCIVCRTLASSQGSLLNLAGLGRQEPKRTIKPVMPREKLDDYGGDRSPEQVAADERVIRGFLKGADPNHPLLGTMDAQPCTGDPQFGYCPNPEGSHVPAEEKCVMCDGRHDVADHPDALDPPPSDSCPGNVCPHPSHLKPVVDVLSEASPGEHRTQLNGDPQRRGETGRWSWKCSCGAKSDRTDLLFREAWDRADEHRSDALRIAGDPQTSRSSSYHVGVDPGRSQTAEGTFSGTKEVKIGPGGDFESVQAWEAAIPEAPEFVESPFPPPSRLDDWTGERAPPEPTEGQRWLDVSTERPPILKTYTSGEWRIVEKTESS